MVEGEGDDEGSEDEDGVAAAEATPPSLGWTMVMPCELTTVMLSVDGQDVRPQLRPTRQQPPLWTKASHW